MVWGLAVEFQLLDLFDLFLAGLQTLPTFSASRHSPIANPIARHGIHQGLENKWHSVCLCKLMMFGRTSSTEQQWCNDVEVDVVGQVQERRWAREGYLCSLQGAH